MKNILKALGDVKIQFLVLPTALKILQILSVKNTQVSMVDSKDRVGAPKNQIVKPTAPATRMTQSVLNMQGSMVLKALGDVAMNLHAHLTVNKTMKNQNAKNMQVHMVDFLVLVGAKM